MPGRIPIVIDKGEFQKVISDLETAQTFANRGQLWLAIEATDWAKARVPRPLTSQVAMNKAQELGIEIKTEKGKRGSALGKINLGEIVKKKRVVDGSIKDALLERTPVKYHPLALQVIAGSRKAATKLGCLQCTSFQREEIRKCSISWCAHYSNRPFKGKAK